MKTVTSLLLGIAAITSLHATPTAPSRVNANQLGTMPYRTSGLIWNDSWRGSGTVSTHGRIAVSCAHVVYDNGWLNGYNIATGYSANNSPAYSTAKIPLRGYWYWTSYTGGTSAAAFNQDFAVHYAYTNLAGGAYSGSSRNESNATHPLNTASSKMIVGFPGSDAHYMNMTGAFTSAYSAQSGHYMWNPSVKGGSGMSGGGVFVNSGGQWLLSGVHVSGDRFGGMGAGVRALNNSAFDLMTRAVTSSGGGSTTPPVVTRTISSTTPLAIRDNSSTWAVRTLSVSGMPNSLTSATVSLNISHTYRGDLEVVLTAPTGRTLTLHNRTGGSADHLVISGQNVTATFSGISPNGVWKVSVRDLAALDVGKLNSCSLTLSAR